MRSTLSVGATLSLFAVLTSAQSVTVGELAFQHAPAHYQDTDSSDYPSEYITAFDFDSDRVSTNNWDNRGDGRWPATVYYSVVESCSHYFITYAFYHPRDWSDIVFDQEHENDMEGALVAVRKDASAFGSVEAMVTIFHRDFFSYARPGSGISSGNESVDGTLSFEVNAGVNRVKTAQEAKGHGLKAWPYISNFTGAATQDGIIYYPTLGAAESPSSGNDRSVPYRLVDIHSTNGLWAAALNDAIVGASAPTFNSFGTFKGDTTGDCGSGLKGCSTNSANTPWGWDDSNDVGVQRGEVALDPAHLFAQYFSGLGNFSQKYLSNKYLQDLRAAGYSSANRPAGMGTGVNLDAMYQKFSGTCAP
jgi:hypothetical protein